MSSILQPTRTAADASSDTAASGSMTAVAATGADDLAVVRDVVRRVGTWRLRFDVDDVRAELRATPWLALHAPTRLWHYLRALEGSELRRVDGSLELILATPVSRRARVGTSAPGTASARRRGGTPGPAVTRQYVLAERVHELAVARPDALDDRERVTLAVALATLMLGGSPAPTRFVTAVLSTVPELALRRPAQTNVLLSGLARRAAPVLREEKVDARSARWTVCEPLRGVWLDWLCEAARRHADALSDVRATAAVGAASQAQLAARLVAQVVASVRSPQWPDGRPVSAREITERIAEARQTGADVGGLVPLADALDRQQVSLTAALQAAGRERYADGTAPRQAPVRRVVHPELSGVRYVPASFPPDVERAWVTWEVLRKATAPPVLAALAEEWRDARCAVDSPSEAVQAVGYVRFVALRAMVDAHLTTIAELTPMLSSTSAALVEALADVRRRVLEMAGGWPDIEPLVAVARAALEPTGRTLPAVLSAPRPLITADDLAALLPASIVCDLAPSVLAATAATVRRTHTAREVRRTRVGQGRAESRPLDRVDALIYAAETGMLPGVAALQTGARLLGRTCADVPLVRRVLRAASAEHRVAAFGALLLLGDETFVGRALLRRGRRLEDIRAPLEAISVVELGWWLGPEVRAELVAAGLRDARQSVKAAARRVQG